MERQRSERLFVETEATMFFATLSVECDHTRSQLRRVEAKQRQLAIQRESARYDQELVARRRAEDYREKEEQARTRLHSVFQGA